MTTNQKKQISKKTLLDSFVKKRGRPRKLDKLKNSIRRGRPRKVHTVSNIK